MRRYLAPSWIVPAVFGVLVAATPRTVAAFDVSSCTTVPDGEVGVLTADLVCAHDEAIQLAGGAKLQMNGHTLTPEIPSAGVAILCNGGKCSVEGPGEIVDFELGIVALSPSRLDVRDVDVHQSGVGVLGDRVRLTDVAIDGGWSFGVIANRVDAARVTVSNKGSDGIQANALQLTDVVVADNAVNGVSARRLKAVNLTAIGNGKFGMMASRPGVVKLADSTLTGNGVRDLATEHSPKLKGSTCGTSRHLSENGGDLGTWGVCAGD